MDEHKEVEIVAVFIHGVLAVLHAIGTLHNLRRRNWTQAGLHFGVMCYDLWAVFVHYSDLKRGRHDKK